MFDAIAELKGASKTVYEADNSKKNAGKKNMLVVSHWLDSGGAPLVLLELIGYFQRNYNITLVSIKDGELRKEFLDRGIDVLIGNVLRYANCDKRVWTSFDLVFLNTIMTHSFLACFQNTDASVLWWLHEPEILIKSIYGRCVPFGLLSDNIKILSVTNETYECVKKYYKVETSILHMGLEDKYCGDLEREDTKVRFFQPAKFQSIKGQDVLVQAIVGLPPEYLDRMEFYFAGSGDEEEPEYYELVEKLSQALSNVVMLGEISKDEVYDCYQQVDCIVAPSRADATPTTIVEGMMFHKIALCSDATGISKYLQDGVSGYVVPSGDSQALKEKLMYIVDHREEWDAVKDAGRQIYMEQFERSHVERQLDDMISEMEKFRIINK